MLFHTFQCHSVINRWARNSANHNIVTNICHNVMHKSVKIMNICFAQFLRIFTLNLLFRLYDFYYASLRYEFRFVMTITICTKKWCSVHLYLQLFVLFTLFVYACVLWGSTHIVLCFCFVFFLCYVASFSGLSIFDCPFGIL